jgi:FAD/FMN-containing dehydrogenase
LTAKTGNQPMSKKQELFLERDDVLSWGRVVRQRQYVAHPNFRDELPSLIAAPGWESKLAIGLRRSYGDSCLNGAGAVIDLTGLDRFILFDAQTGSLRAEAGVSLSAVLQLVVPHGWFLPTTPGTRFVTLGGAVSNDVHGKNHHHAGPFGVHVVAIGLLRSDGRRLVLGPDNEQDLFRATIGGLGLTGVIEWVELQLVSIRSAYLDVEILPYENLGAFWDVAEESVQTYEHTIAWIDCVSAGAHKGRGVFLRANWADDGRFDAHSDRRFKTFPIEVPSRTLNRLTVGAFNELYYNLHRIKKRMVRQHYSTYNYPLDGILNWNKLYGSNGMLQYQCAIPFECAREATPLLLEEVSNSGQASFLAAIKTFGDRPSPGMLSFPRPGVTLALDFPNRGEMTLALMSRLDAILREAQGALYPAKDGRMSAEMFRLSYPQWESFAAFKDPGVNSDFWRRISQ